ncbi:centaurin 5 [Schizosaccharomyces cryophilus OY26]|uniref:ADP-ribosylation factor GTPase-activating protein n=1 Tax=Schizosaccharomyces cryophilus (strain OY26 / ATCC MYA-4695 / CBS 11777 / NBRC 106824 / NRRL Y48691) TaxID=653667 RepID=S9WXU0_SCHCR|nr:centaurin 5 [Schizosaccharomyces cryophilus OY26]EPY49532.1 centaurin 5 [Schizosaccharomyces cryophilus OY26]
MAGYNELVPIQRFNIQSLKFLSQNGNEILNIQSSESSFFDSKYRFSRRNHEPVEFIQVREEEGPMVKVIEEDGLELSFKLIVRASETKRELTNLTFIHGSSPQEIDRLITREFSTDANFQNHHQVALVGDVSFAPNESERLLEWKWQYSHYSSLYYYSSGCPNYICFAEYDKRLNRLVPLQTFQFWLVESEQDSTPATPSFTLRLAEDGAISPEVPEPHSLLTATEQFPIQSPPPSNVNPTSRELDQTEPEDGPLFRATILNFERTTHEMRMAMKKLIKRADQVAHSHGMLYMSHKEFVDAFERAAKINPPAFKPFLDYYYENCAKSLDNLNIDRAHLLRNSLIEPLRRIYDNDIKNAYSKKKDFEETSRDYYTSLTRYLSKSEKVSSADKAKESKFSAKRRDFELSRFDYYSYMQDINGGRKGQEVLSALTSFAANDYSLIHSTMAEIDSIRPSIIMLQDVVNEANKEFLLLRAEREERRRLLETSSRELDDQDAEIAAQAYRAKIGQDTSAKQGLLLAFAKSNSDLQMVSKAGWHKYWVVLDHGKICEYSNWKQSLELHEEPIDLLMATVRIPQSFPRKFCFELITPQLRRIYQATSKTEMHSWVEAIQYAISESISLKGRRHSASEDSTINKYGSTSSIGKALQRVASVTSPGRYSGSGGDLKDKKAQKPISLSKAVKESQISDQYCADCRFTSRVEWCAINFPAVLCIDCSGIHRSLGTHVSKVRSLDLDKLSTETVELLRATGNQLINEVYEAKLSEPNAKSIENQEERASFIKEKYVQKLYVQAIADSDVNAALYDAVERGDLKQVILRIAQGADVNYQSVILVSLRKSNYLIAELLSLNGAGLNFDEAIMDTLPARAQAFLMTRSTN